jgi:3-deoxy-D-manno-octulosonic-acid transferase
MKTKLFTAIYTLFWTLALPVVFVNKRLREHWPGRLGWGIGRKSHDLWIQAASVGEGFLAISLTDYLLKNHPELSILITTNTSQGLDILTDHFQKYSESNRPDIRICPVDHPLVVGWFMRRISPKIVVLLETELWPGILMQCKKRNCPVLVANGRMSPKSLAGYLRFQRVLKDIGPQQIMAISSSDASRFATIFENACVTTMPNIKFDRIGDTPAISYVANPLSRFFRPSSKFVVFGSIREEEEPAIQNALTRLITDHPTTIAALVPRHLHRISAWKEFLASGSIPWILRSRLAEEPVKPGTIVLWDLFGELPAVYALAKTAFVGGSLAPLGGQNFLEPLAQGVRPVIGPSWSNFNWVGEDLITQGFVTIVATADELANELGSSTTMSRENVRAATDEYIASKQGGTAMVAQRIIESVSNGVSSNLPPQT